MKNFFLILLIFIGSKIFAQSDTLSKNSILKNAPVVFLKGNHFYTLNYTFRKYDSRVISIEKENAFSDRTGFVTVLGHSKINLNNYVFNYSYTKWNVGFGLRHHLANKWKSKVIDIAPAILMVHDFGNGKSDIGAWKYLKQNTSFSLALDSRVFLGPNVGLNFGVGFFPNINQSTGFKIGFVVKP